MDTNQKLKIKNQKCIAMSPRIIIFDLGRVLVNICESWRHACDMAGMTQGRAGQLTPEERAAMMQLVVAHETGRIDQASFCNKASTIFQLDPTHINALSDIYLINTFPGAIELIDELNQRGSQTACLSNTNPHHWAIMSDREHPAWLPMHKFHHRFASHLIGHRKPADAIYEHVENETGFSGQQIVFFDDLKENVEAATRRGWIGVQVEKGINPIEQIRTALSQMGVL
jgi:putative hydrolase of the HAD superfamily